MEGLRATPGALIRRRIIISRIGFLGASILKNIIRNPQDSIGNYFGRYTTSEGSCVSTLMPGSSVETVEELQPRFRV